MKNGGSDIVFKHQRAFLSMNCTPNIIAINISEKNEGILEGKTY